MVNVKKITLISLFTAIALVLNLIESKLTIFPVPGLRIGLANAVTLIVVILYGRREGGALLLVRIMLGSIFSGGLMPFLFSLAGGSLSYFFVVILYPRLKNDVWILSVISALSHNIGQTAIAYIFMRSVYVWWYLAPLSAAAVISGVFTGVMATFISKRVRPRI